MGNSVPEPAATSADFGRFCILAGLLSLSLSCGSSSQTATGTTGPSPLARCSIQAQAPATAFSPAGGTGTLHITANRECAWSARAQASWLTLAAPTDGTGNGTVTFTVAANHDPSQRSAALRVNDQDVQISQAPGACGFRISSHAETVAAQGEDKSIQVTASSPQCEWTARTDDEWIEIVSGQQGSGDGVVRFRVGPLAGGVRAGTLVVAGAEVRIEQTRPAPSPCSISIGPVSFTVPASGGAGEIHVTAGPGCVWQAESLAPWITIVARSAPSGPGVLSFRVGPTDGPARSGLLRVGGSTATVDQSPGCAFTVTPLNFGAPVAGGTGTVTVQTADGCSWSAATSTAWIILADGSSGRGSGRLDYGIAPNTGPERSGSLTVGGRTITVTQPSGCRYEVSPPAHEVPPSGGPTLFSVATAAACPWTASSQVSWLAPATGSGTGAAQVSVVTSPNNGPPRTGTLTIAGHTVSVQQASPCTYMLNPPSSAYAASGGEGLVLVFVSGPCTWSASTDANWISVVGESGAGTGSGFLRFAVAPNAGGARSGTVVIAGIPHQVSQAAR